MEVSRLQKVCSEGEFSVLVGLVAGPVEVDGVVFWDATVLAYIRLGLGNSGKPRYFMGWGPTPQVAQTAHCSWGVVQYSGR